MSNDIANILRPLDGISAFVKSGEKVFVKPDFNTSDYFIAPFNFYFLRAVLSEIDSQKPSQIILGESPAFFRDSKKFFEEKDP